MSEILFPMILATGGLIAAFVAYRGIRRGGARFYTLERESMLRRASLMLVGSTALFLAAIGWLVYNRPAATPAPATEGEAAVAGEATGTPEPDLEQFPPTEAATPFLEEIPTVTPTAIICRAVVEGTGGNGLTLRDNPGGIEMAVLAEGSILTLLEDAPAEVDGIVWRKVRAVGGDDGWVAQDFLTIRAPCE